MMKEKIINVGGFDWDLSVSRNTSFWHQVLTNEGMYHHTVDFGVNAKLENLSLIVDSTKASIFAHKENYKNYVNAVNEATDSLEKVEVLKDKYKKFAEKLINSLENCQKNLLVESFKLFIDNYRIYTAGLMITTVLGRSQLENLITRFKEINYPENKTDNAISVITYPDFKTPFFNSQIDLLKIGVEIQENKIQEEDVLEKLDNWLINYGHIPVNFCEEPYSRADLEAQLKEDLKNSCREKIGMLEKQHVENISGANQKLLEIGDSEVFRLAKTLAEITSLNEFRKNVFCRVSLGYRSIFDSIVSRVGLTNWRDGFYLKYEEMIDILNDKKIDLKKLIFDRQKIAMFINQNGEQVYLDKNKTEEIYDFVYTKDFSKKSEETIIKGFSASKGLVRGTAKIVLSSKDFGKLNRGEVLVTTMTSVDFVPVMEKASAFVTNEGGITSHASIVAREMKKPCIIGTKIATKVLKDGDLVEVDANNGVVKILGK